jgi:drug/metabolite transporter (DMT)-like permease
VQSRRFDFSVLALGVVAVSTAAVFIRQADAPALIIAASRLALASLPLLLYCGATRTSLRPSTRDRQLLTLLSGVFLALHFAFWIASVKQTSVVTSVVLVTSQPLFVAVASGPLLGEKPHRSVWLGIGLAALGAAVMVVEDIGKGRDTVIGDLFALLGAVFAAAYIMAGRRLRTTGSDWLPYATSVYSTAAVILVAVALVAGHGFSGYSGETYLYFALLALVPQLIGHTAINRSLGHLPAASVAIAILGEPIGATLLGAVFLDEVPSVFEFLGGALVLAGVYAGLRATLRIERPATAPD